MSTRAVSTRHERRTRLCDARERVEGIAGSLHPCRITWRANDNQLVIGELAIHPLWMLLEKACFGLWGVTDDEINQSVRHHLQRTAAASRMDAKFDAGFGMKCRHKDVQQAGMLHACGRRNIKRRRTDAIGACR